MTDLVTVFDHSGKPIGELPGVSIKRDSKLERTVDAATGDFLMGVNDPKATAKLLKWLNFALVQSDEVGVKDWCGLMWCNDTGIPIKDGELQVPLRSCEWLLYTRYTNPLENIAPAKPPGEIFKIVLYTIAQRIGSLPVLSADTSGIATGGELSQKEWHYENCYEITNKLATDNNAYWWFDPSRDPQTGCLVLTPVFKFKQGSTFIGQLVEGGENANLVTADIVEKCRPGHQMATRVQAYGSFDNWHQPLLSDMQVNAAFESECGTPILHVLASLDSTSKAELNAAALTELRNCTPRLYVTGWITKEPYPQIGDYAPVVLTNTGSFLQARRGPIITMRVLMTSMVPDGTTVAVTLEEVLDGEI